MNSLVSIVIPTYNRVELIEACLDSVLAQTYKYIEVIVSDNCSTDGTQSIVKRYAALDSRVTLIESSRNRGPVLNWHRGLRAAKGIFCKLLFSDDTLLAPDAIKEYLSFMQNDGIVAVYSSIRISATPSHGKLYYADLGMTKNINCSRYIYKALIRPSSCPVSPCAFFFIRQRYLAVLTRLISKLGHDEEMMRTGAGVDLLSILEYMKQGGGVQYINNPLVFFRAHKNSITINESEKVAEIYRAARILFIRSHYGLIKAWFFEKYDLFRSWTTKFRNI